MTRTARPTATMGRRTEAAPAFAPYRLSARQFVRMIEAGVFPEGARVELIGGMLVDKMTQNDPHACAVGQLGDSLRALLPRGWFVREEKPIGLGRIDRPEPDLAVARGRHGDYGRRAPAPRDLAILVEVADTSYDKDRQEKWPRYASARVPAYWIVNLRARTIEVYTDPSGHGPAAKYRSCAVFAEDAAVPVVIDGREVGRIPVRDVLP